jgi:KRAB domain-containing zinc finger protein
MHQRTHKEVKSFECNVCEKIFSQLGILNQHRRIHTGEKSFQCDICKKNICSLGNFDYS